jgi:basic membrane protein A and related proteins
MRIDTARPCCTSPTRKRGTTSLTLRATALGLLAVLVGGAVAAPEKKGPAGSEKPVTVGFIYVGPKDDFGYSQCHAEGAAFIRKMPGVKTVEEERVPENLEVQKTMVRMIEKDKAKLIFPTSFGYFDPHVLQLAKKYPDVAFIHCGGLWDAAKHPKNVCSYFGYSDEPVYVSGVVAAHATKTKKLGYVAAKGIPQVLRNINAFALGARSIDPKITVHVIFTNDWQDWVKEAEATNALLDLECDVMTCHVDSPKVVAELAVKRDAWFCGYHCSQASIAKDKYLTGAEWNWGKIYAQYVNTYRDGNPIPNMRRGGLKDGFLINSPYGPKVSEAGKKAGDAAKAKFMQEDFAIFKGPVRDNTGKIVIPAGTSYGQKAIELEYMDYLVEGVSGRR